MAGFEGIKWSGRQMLFLLKSKAFEIQAADAKVYAVSRSIHYGLFLAFEGIRFFCKKNEKNKLEVIFLNLNKNLERLRRGMSFNLSSSQQELVPSVEEMTSLFIRYFKEPPMLEFLGEMASLNAQGYLRPFTFDEDQSIGVTFPGNPSLRAVICRYDRYLGEPFSGVVIPNLVRAVGINGTGCLKLAVNYLMSVKAVDAAKQIMPEASSALFLDDRPYAALESRTITEWDSSCCLFAFKDGTVVKIPESNLILPSITITGMCKILEQMGAKIEERDISYGELIERTKKQEIVAVCSVGTAGILNRADKLLLVDEAGITIAVHTPDKSHEIFHKLGEARTYYWDMYQEKVPVPDGLTLNKFELY
ncbi:MAG: aminotransferase class IV [Candidatus Aminicenantes bacterium]|nr:aminotransferase class IV [Candidatus Aminicenantes bacterium]